MTSFVMHLQGEGLVVVKLDEQHRQPVVRRHCLRLCKAACLRLSRQRLSHSEHHVAVRSHPLSACTHRELAHALPSNWVSTSLPLTDRRLGIYAVMQRAKRRLQILTNTSRSVEIRVLLFTEVNRAKHPVARWFGPPHHDRQMTRSITWWYRRPLARLCRRSGSDLRSMHSSGDRM